MLSRVYKRLLANKTKSPTKWQNEVTINYFISYIEAIDFELIGV